MLDLEHIKGNTEAVEFLERILELAKKGRIGYAVAVLGEEPNHIHGGYAGAIELEPIALDGMNTIGTKIEKSIENRTLDKIDESLDKSYVCFNVAASPVTFDFIPWLVTREMERIQANAPFPLKVGFFLGRDGKTGLTADNRIQMFNNIVRPALGLIGAVEDPRAIEAPFVNYFSVRDIIRYFKEGQTVPVLKPKFSKIDIEPGYVTITLRETDYYPHRNSNIEEWIRFATWLQEQGERVIFIRDTAKAEEPIEGFDICPKASKYLDYRMAMYDNAKCNMFVSNGPVSLAYFSDKPWLMFINIDETSSYAPETTQYWLDHCDTPPGEQYAWSLPSQRIVWKPDYFTNIVQAWKEYETTWN